MFVHTAQDSKMIRANRGGTKSFLARLDDCNDAVLREIRLKVGTPNGHDRATLRLAARDSETAEWVELSLTLFDVTEFRLTENPKEYHFVLSLGLQVHHVDDLYYFDFGPTSEEPGGIDEVRDSRFYMASRRFVWKIKPYPREWER